MARLERRRRVEADVERREIARAPDGDGGGRATHRASRCGAAVVTLHRDARRSTTRRAMDRATSERDARKKRVLCLHGFAQDAATFRAKTGAIRKALKSKCEFVYLDGTHDVAGAFEASSSDLRAMGATDEASASLAWFLSGENRASGATKSTDAGWTRPALSAAYDGWEGSAASIRKMCAECGPFDGIVGFSQGATAAVAALADVEALRASVSFVVLVAGFEPRDPNFPVPTTPLAVKSLHVHGDKDSLVTRERVRALADHFDANRREFWFHDGSHGVPSTPLAKFVKSWIDA
jgi:dienelactone hydrolase|tara:strand:+ start:15860 stop:16741 length:882 start_codon:yes stop_codon:yes gene_type:complete